MHAGLTDFLNHGILPFVGRSSVAERIISFWRTTAEANRLRIALLNGEAGIGKSRLVEETIPSIRRAGGAVIHTKLYPESTASIAPLIARALRFLNARRRSTPPELEDTLASVVAELRRLARLRPTLLIVEDIHLLSGETLDEFAHLLEALSDEVISILCLTRPVELPARTVLERYPIEEIHLNNLQEKYLAELCEKLFNAPPDPKFLRMLRTATLGNPLAVRSAIRGALRSGALSHDSRSNSWRPSLPAEAFTQTLRRNVEFLSEGMTAHLTEEERRGARSLATLGEIFAHEAARAILPDADEMIESLLFKGIIVRSSTQAAPLPGTASAHPVLAFTHTILHTHLVQQGGMDPTQLVTIIGSDLPLYSILPFQLLTQRTGRAEVPKEEVRKAIARAIEVASALDQSSDWELAIEIWRAAASVTTIHADLWSPDETILLQSELLANRLLLLRRSDNHDEFGKLVERFLAITEGPLPEHLRIYRLKALAALHGLGRRKDPAICHDAWKRAERFVEEHPELLHTIDYLHYLESAARSMLYLGEHAMLRSIEERMMALAAGEGATEEYRRMTKQIIAFHFLDFFETEEDLARRLRVLHEIEPYVDPQTKMSFLISKIDLLRSIGHMDEALQTADHALPLFREQALANNSFYGALNRLAALGAIGSDIDEIESEIDHLCEGAPELPTLFARMMLIETALLRGEREWLRQRMEIHGRPMQYLRPETQVALALEIGASREYISAVSRVASDSFRPIAGIVLDLPDIDPGHLYPAIRSALGAPILRLAHLIEKRGVFDLIVTIESIPGWETFANSIQEDIQGALTRALEWLDARKLHACMQPFIELYGNMLGRKRLGVWKNRIAEIIRERHSLHGTDEPNSGARTSLSMLGTIDFRPPNGAPIPIRGSRLRTLLGLMVADRMLAEQLDHREFSTIVSGAEDPAKARKTLNGVVFRLRELLGHDAILTDGETPQLNLDLIDVDLLQAHITLRDAATALRNESLLQAQRKLLNALEIVRGEVPFPSLYEDFFEQAREMFETELRSLLLKGGRRLLDGDDPTSAEELLHRGFEVIAGDEEIAEMLCEALVMLGKRAEAERVRMRMRETGGGDE